MNPGFYVDVYFTFGSFAGGQQSLVLLCAAQVHSRTKMKMEPYIVLDLEG